MTRREIFTIGNQLALFEYGNASRNVEPIGKGVHSFKLHYAVQRSIDKIETEKKAWQKTFHPHEKTQEFETKRNEIIEKYKKELTEKNKDKILKKQEEEMDSLKSEYKETLDFNDETQKQYDKFLDEEIESDFKLYTIPEEIIPSDLDNIQTELIRKIIVPKE